MPGNLPIPAGHMLANIETLPYCHLCEVQAKQEALLHVCGIPEYSELNSFSPLLTLGHLKLMFIHGQITPNSVTHPF